MQAIGCPAIMQVVQRCSAKGRWWSRAG